MKTRQLSSIWTVELEQDTDPQYGEGLTEEMSKIFQEEIDWEVTCELMLELGWTKISISDNTARLFYVKHKMIESWVQKNIKGKSRGRGNTWLFEHSKDATLFALRWL